jgi:hypothetical protein
MGNTVMPVEQVWDIRVLAAVVHVSSIHACMFVSASTVV